MVTGYTTTMAKVIHTIKGIRYLYEHTRRGTRVVCKYLGPADGSKKSGANTTQLRNSPPRTLNKPDGTVETLPPRYATQEELDTEIRRAYVRGGAGVQKIQTIFKDELDLHPTRREVENYLTQDLCLTLRKRTQNAKQKPLTDKEKKVVAAKAEYEQSQKDVAEQKIRDDIATRDTQIAALQSDILKAEKENLRLKERLMDFAEMGRAPTQKEIEEMVG